MRLPSIVVSTSFYCKFRCKIVTPSKQNCQLPALAFFYAFFEKKIAHDIQYLTNDRNKTITLKKSGSVSHYSHTARKFVCSVKAFSTQPQMVIISDSAYCCKVSVIELFDCSEHLGNDSVQAKVCLCLSISLTSVPLPLNVVETKHSN